MSPTEREIDGLRFTLTDTPGPEDRDYIHEQIKAFNNQASEHHRTVRRVRPRPLDILAHDGRGHLVGGLIGSTYWGWLEVRDLWLDEEGSL